MAIYSQADLRQVMSKEQSLHVCSNIHYKLSPLIYVLGLNIDGGRDQHFQTITIEIDRNQHSQAFPIDVDRDQHCDSALIF